MGKKPMLYHLKGRFVILNFEAPGSCHLLRSPVVSTSSVELAKVLERRIGFFVVGTNVAGVSNLKIKCDMYTV